MKITKDNRYLMIEKYHNDTLSSEEVEAFYEKFDADPAFRDDVERMGILIHGLENLSEADKAKIRLHLEAEKTQSYSHVGFLTVIKEKIKSLLEEISPKPIPSFAIATSFVVLTIAGIYLFMNWDNLFGSEKGNLITEENFPNNKTESDDEILKEFLVPVFQKSNLGITHTTERIKVETWNVQTIKTEENIEHYKFQGNDLDTLLLFLRNSNPNSSDIVIQYIKEKTRDGYSMQIGDKNYWLIRQRAKRELKPIDNQ